MFTILLIQITLLFRFVQSKMDEGTRDAILAVTKYDNITGITIGENHFWGTHGCRWYPECRYDNLMFYLLSATWLFVLAQTIILVCMQRKLLSMGTALVHLERANHYRVRWIDVTLRCGNGHISLKTRKAVQATDRTDESERQLEKDNPKALVLHYPDVDGIERTITIPTEETSLFPEQCPQAKEQFVSRKDDVPALFETDSKHIHSEDDDTNTYRHCTRDLIGNIEKEYLASDKQIVFSPSARKSISKQDVNQYFKSTTIAFLELSPVQTTSFAIKASTTTEQSRRNFAANIAHEELLLSTTDGRNHLGNIDIFDDGTKGTESNIDYMTGCLAISSKKDNDSDTFRSRFSGDDNEHVRGELESVDIREAPTSVEDSLCMVHGNQEDLHEVTNKESSEYSNSEQIEILSAVATRVEPKSSGSEHSSGDSNKDFHEDIDAENSGQGVTRSMQSAKYSHKTILVNEDKNDSIPSPDRNQINSLLQKNEEEIQPGTTDFELCKNRKIKENHTLTDYEYSEQNTAEIYVTGPILSNQNISEAFDYVHTQTHIGKDNKHDTYGQTKVHEELWKEDSKDDYSNRSRKPTESLSGAVDAELITEDQIIVQEIKQVPKTDPLFLDEMATSDTMGQRNRIDDNTSQDLKGSAMKSERRPANWSKRMRSFKRRKPQRKGRSCLQTWPGKVTGSFSVVKEKVTRKEKIAVNARHHLLKSSHSEPLFSKTEIQIKILQHKEIFRNVEANRTIVSFRRRNDYTKVVSSQEKNASWWYKMRFKLDIFLVSYYARTPRSDIHATIDSIIDSRMFANSKQIRDLNYQVQKENAFENKWKTELAEYLYNPVYFNPGYVQILVFPANNQRNPTYAESAYNYWFRLISLATYEGACSLIRLAQNGFIHEEHLGPYSTRCYRCGCVYSNGGYFDDIRSIHIRLSPDCPLLRDTERSSQDGINEDIMAHASSVIVNGSEAVLTQSSESVNETSASGNVVTGTRDDENGKDDEQDEKKSDDSTKQATLLKTGLSKLGLYEGSENAQIGMETLYKLDISYARHEENRAELEELKRGNKELRDKQTCKICLDRLVCMVLIPCGHWCCRICAWGIRKCHVCRSPISKRFMPI